MLSDRELLELAAKAAGIEWYGMAGDDNDSCAYFDIGPDEVVKWNPLRDDGDALRLAVQCGLEVSFVDDEPGREGLDIRACVGFPASTERPCRIKYVFEDHRGDIFAATRRAIVRAAAEIGRQHD